MKTFNQLNILFVFYHSYIGFHELVWTIFYKFTHNYIDYCFFVKSELELTFYKIVTISFAKVKIRFVLFSDVMIVMTFKFQDYLQCQSYRMSCELYTIYVLSVLFVKSFYNLCFKVSSCLHYKFMNLAISWMKLIIFCKKYLHVYIFMFAFFMNKLNDILQIEDIIIKFSCEDFAKLVVYSCWIFQVYVCQDYICCNFHEIVMMNLTRLFVNSFSSSTIYVSFAN